MSSYGLRVANNQKLMVRSISKAVQAKILLSAEPGITAKESKYTQSRESVVSFNIRPTREHTMPQIKERYVKSAHTHPT